MNWLLVTYLPGWLDGCCTLAISYDPPRRPVRVAPPSVRAAELSAEQVDWLAGLLIGKPR